MGGNYGNNALVFLIETVFGMYLIAIMLRFLLQVMRADFYNPVSQFLVKVTNPPLIPLRRIIPGVMGIDAAAIVLMIVIQALDLFLIVLIGKGVTAAPGGLLVLTMSELLNLTLNVFLFSILIQVVISWVNPGSYNPTIGLLYSINEPLLGRARRLLPPIHGFDLSPIVVMVAIQLLKILLIAPIQDLGGRLAFG